MSYQYPLSSLYRLPYTREDSPSVIIEPTTDCNLRCPGCYRRSGIENTDYMSLEEACRYVDEVRAIRNISQLLISGGEPLMYPELVPLIQYALGLGLKVKINSNGTLLDRASLIRFRELGVEGVQIHLDKHQAEYESEQEVIEKRDEYCRLFREVGGIRLGFHNIVHRKDLPDLPAMAEFFARNSDIVSEINFAAFCPAPQNIDLAKVSPQAEAGLQIIKEHYRTVAQKVREAFGLEFGAYLAAQHEDDRPGKLYALLFYRDGKLVGSADREQCQAAHDLYYREHGNYGYGTEMFQAYLRVTGQEDQGLDVQYIRVSLPPLPVGKALSLCDSCVDPVLYENRLVPMCVLEYVRNKDNVTIEIDR